MIKEKSDFLFNFLSDFLNSRKSGFLKTGKLNNRLKSTEIYFATCHSKESEWKTRGEKILEQFSTTQFFTGFENPNLFCLLCSSEEKCGKFKSRKNRALENCSYIFFTLKKIKSFFARK